MTPGIHHWGQNSLRRMKRSSPLDASLVSYLQKQKEKGRLLSPADKKFLEACKHVSKQERQTSGFGWLPEKKSSLASYLPKQKEQGQTLSQADKIFLEGLE